MSDTSQTLHTLLHEEHAQLIELAALLDKEFDVARASEDLTDILAQKQAQLSVLDAATGKRLEWLEAHNLPTHGAPLHEVAAAADDNGRLTDLLTRFESDARACRERNRQLAQFNLRRQRSVQQALRLLTCRPDEVDTDYTAQGQTDAQLGTRLLGSA